MIRCLPNNVKQITYRGSLRSCNYTCEYCPFSKRRATEKELLQDQQGLLRFVEKIEEAGFQEPVSLLFAPYGEAMIHQHYWNAFSRLSRLKQVTRISCQTNLSFNGGAFLSYLNEEGADLDKVSLWASFHPSMTTAEEFAAKAELLAEDIRLCAGMVGDPASVEQMKRLKELLPGDVYFWINQRDGLSRKYTRKEIEVFTDMDPLFPLELKRYSTMNRRCRGGVSSIFVEADGRVSPCNRSKITLGNFYGDCRLLEDCEACGGICDCFLAYRNRTDLPELLFLGKHSGLRLKGQVAVKCAFLDIDGTLTDERGLLRNSAVKAVEQLHDSGIAVFLATARPFESAMSKCRELRGLLQGGIFAEGADVRIFRENFRKVTCFDSTKIPGQPRSVCGTEGGIFRLIYGEHREELESFGRVSRQSNMVAVAPFGVCKEKGMSTILEQLGVRKEDCFAMGNGDEDIGMLRLAGLSAAPPKASEGARVAALQEMEMEEAAAVLERMNLL